MSDKYASFSLPHSSAFSLYSLISIWLAGLLTGSFIFDLADDGFSSWIRTACFHGVSFFGLLSVMLFPLFVSAFAVFLFHFWLFIPVVFWKAFSFSLISRGVMAAFGTAGWLVRLLLMFGDGCSLPILWWYWLRISLSPHKSVIRETIAASAAMLIAVFLDYFLISPILAELIF